jgi:hypothetical protein
LLESGAGVEERRVEVGGHDPELGERLAADVA